MAVQKGGTAMRVITGTARGTRLEAPEGQQTRPTSDMAKEAVFSILHFELAGAAVLDLFAGSGQLGIEAHSRAAQEVIRRNLAAAKLTPLGRVAAMDASSFLAGCRDRFDIALLDPPYDGGQLETALAGVAALMNDGGVIVCETDRRAEPPAMVGTFCIQKAYRYGRPKITPYRKRHEEDD